MFSMSIWKSSLELKTYGLVRIQMKRDYSGIVLKPPVTSHGPVFDYSLGELVNSFLS